MELITRVSEGLSRLVTAINAVNTKVDNFVSALAGSDKQVQYNNNGALAGASNTKIVDGNLLLAANTPTTPQTDGNISMFNRQFAGRDMLCYKDVNGYIIPLQTSISFQRVIKWKAISGSTTISLDGIVTATSVGTATASTSGVYFNYKRLNYVSSATRNYVTGMYWANINGAIACQMQYGFYYSCRFMVNDTATVADARMFIGLSTRLTAPTWSDNPATFTNSIGVAQLATTDKRLHIVYGGSVAQTAIDTGIDFVEGRCYNLYIYSKVGATDEIGITLVENETGVEFSTTLSGTAETVLPANNLSLVHRAYRSNGNTTGAVTLGLSEITLETN